MYKSYCYSQVTLVCKERLHQIKFSWMFQYIESISALHFYSYARTHFLKYNFLHSQLYCFVFKIRIFIYLSFILKWLIEERYNLTLFRCSHYVLRSSYHPPECRWCEDIFSIFFDNLVNVYQKTVSSID